jgi:hypothetical protein
LKVSPDAFLGILMIAMMLGLATSISTLLVPVYELHWMHFGVIIFATVVAGLMNQIYSENFVFFQNVIMKLYLSFCIPFVIMTYVRRLEVEADISNCVVCREVSDGCSWACVDLNVWKNDSQLLNLNLYSILYSSFVVLLNKAIVDCINGKKYVRTPVSMEV